MTITKRATKGSELTWAELDGNFDHLSNASGVNFTQAGVGAVTRNVQDKLRE